MRKFLSFLLIAATWLSTTGNVSGQVAHYQITNPCIVAEGSYMQPPYTWVAPPCYVGFPWYTTLDTPTANTGTDTFWFKLQGQQNSVYTWCNVTTISGTPTSTVLTLSVDADSGKGVAGYTPIYTTTLTATSPQVVSYKIDKWPYTKFRWTWQGAGTERCSWTSGVMVRFKDEEEEEPPNL